jgi:hypothetical protein
VVVSVAKDSKDCLQSSDECSRSQCPCMMHITVEGNHVQAVQRNESGANNFDGSKVFWNIFTVPPFFC